jgi:protein O-mannosyl-transferase
MSPLVYLRCNPRAVIFLIVALASVAYSNTMFCDLQFDDLRVILEDGYIKNWDNVTTVNHWQNVNLRPLSLFSFAVNYSLHGINVWGYHLVNFTVHCTASILVFFLSLKLARLALLPNPVMYAGFAAGIFALHPLQTQSVTYIVQRMASLSAMFYIAAIYVYLQARLKFPYAKQKLTLIVLLSVLFIVFSVSSVLSKQIGLTIPIVIAGLELFFLSRFAPKLSITLAAFYIASFSAAVFYAAYNGLLPSAGNMDRYSYFISQLSVLPKYIGMYLFPIGQNIDHLEPLASSFSVMSFIGATIYFICILAVFLPINKILRFASLFFAGSMLVESSFIPIHDIFVEHRMYLPILPLSLLAAFAAGLLARQLNYKAACSIATVLIIAMVAATFARNAKWATEISIWHDSCKKNPENYRAHNNLGKALMKNAQYHDAIVPLKQALVLQPGLVHSINNLSVSYSKLGQQDLAGYYAKLAARGRRLLPGSWFALGLFYHNTGDFSHALDAYNKCLQLNSRYYDAILYKSELLSNEGMHQEALNIKEHLLKLNPDFVVYRNKQHLCSPFYKVCRKE